MSNDDLSDIAVERKGPHSGMTHRRLWAHGIAWGMLPLLLVAVVPKFESMFADFRVPASRFTRVVIGASHLVVAVAPRIVVVLLLALIGADWLVLEGLARRKAVGAYRAWSAVMLTAPLILSALTVVAVGSLYIQIMKML